MHYKYFLSTLSIALLSVPAFSQTPPADVFDSVNARFTLVCQANADIKGGILKIEKVGHWTGKWTYGVRDTVTNTPVTGTEQYRIGSISKTFLATAVMKLASVGAISLNDTIGTYLPGYINNVIPHHSAITLRHLLRHTSGIADPVNDPGSPLSADILANPYATISFDTLILHYLSPLTPFSAPSDTCYYSNTNYWILGKVVEHVTGVTYARYIDSVILQPLSLSHTYIPALSDSSITSPYLHGYLSIPGLPRLDASIENVSWAYSAGSIISTVDDVMAFYKALRSGAVIASAWVDTMTNFVAYTPATGSPYLLKYGCGIFDVTNSSENVHFIGHNGEVPGYGSIMYYYPQHNTYITATLGASASDYADVLAILIDKYLDEETGIIDNSVTFNSVTLYPIPCSNLLNINCSIPFDKIRVFSAAGKLVMETNGGGSTVIDVSKLSSGTYFISLVNSLQRTHVIRQFIVGR